MTGVEAWFSDDIETARARFLQACDRLGLRVTSFPGRAPADARAPRPYCDVARLGSPEAERALVLCPAAGGGAGFAGAGVATGLVAGDLVRALPREVACVVVHAVNPDGALWPADQPAPSAEAGDAWHDELLSAAEARYAAYRAERFDRDRLAGRTLASVSEPAWDGEVLDAIAERFLAGRKRLLFLDIRTGPGRFGEVETAAAGPPFGDAETARRWLDLPLDGAPQALDGGAALPAGGLPARLSDPDAAVATAVLEVGTYAMATLLEGGGGGIAAYPQASAWRETCWHQVEALVRRGFEGLAADAD